MEQIKGHDSVLKFDQKLQDNKYDLGRLVNIRDKDQKSPSREISKRPE